MSIYVRNPFRPTFLYIKQHALTGKLYFGKTINNPEEYSGSGVYWKRHLKIHGKEHVVNLWYCLFYDENDLNECAILCSKLWNIVDSEEWANLNEENGFGGGPTGPNLTKGKPGQLNPLSRTNWDPNSDRENLRRKRQSETQLSKSKDENINSYSRNKTQSEIDKMKDSKKFRRVTRIKDRKEMDVSNFNRYLIEKPHLFV